ncbi:unnamed protein product [Hermetia illucens]|uniref:Peptidase S1 domain-containing protein n=1 Tax=Hermetia illucens TaxID=343691 RepID=A0A7R8UIU1_HERIL|nr:unnamed protein product [Hermetia illucens]
MFIHTFNRLSFYILLFCILQISYALKNGTQNAKIGQFPCTVVLESRLSKKTFAVGVLIHEQYVLGSHLSMVLGTYWVTAIVGDVNFSEKSSSTTRQVRNVTHRFRREMEDNDYTPLEVFRVDQPFNLTKAVQIGLISHQLLKVGMRLEITGFDQENMVRDDGVKHLVYGTMTIVNRSMCPVQIPGLWEEYLCLLPPPGSNVWASVEDIGSPVFFQGKVVGVLSPIYIDYKNNYTTIQRLRPSSVWINKVLSYDINNNIGLLAIPVNENDTASDEEKIPYFRPPVPIDLPKIDPDIAATTIRKPPVTTEEYQDHFDTDYDQEPDHEEDDGLEGKFGFKYETDPEQESMRNGIGREHEKSEEKTEYKPLRHRFWPRNTQSQPNDGYVRMNKFVVDPNLDRFDTSSKRRTKNSSFRVILNIALHISSYLCLQMISNLYVSEFK